jgi:exocyst complex component 4
VLTILLAILDQVRDEWDFIIDPDVRLIVHIAAQNDNSLLGLQFNNVDLALQLLDNSSLGKDMDSFRRTEDMLGKALKGSVDSASIP